MSNLSNVGFGASSDEAFEELINQIYQQAYPVEVNGGVYMVFADPSGAELWLQINEQNQFTGFNPHYRGQSKRRVRLTNEVERPESELDGAFYAWAEPIADSEETESGQYPFVFDLPDAQKYQHIRFPQDIDIQLTAFAQEITVFASEEDFNKSQEDQELKWATQSFIPSGLFHPNEQSNPQPSQAYGIFTGIIKEVALKTNAFTQQQFYWLLTDTLGGTIDVVADPQYFDQAPQKNGVIQGQFWLSGDLLSEPEQLSKKERKGFLSKFF